MKFDPSIYSSKALDAMLRFPMPNKTRNKILAQLKKRQAWDQIDPDYEDRCFIPSQQSDRN